MRDIDLAKQLLLEEGLTLVLVRDGEVLFKGKGKGLKELSSIYREQADLLLNSAAADTVIGKAAAMFYSAGQIAEVDGALMSEAATEHLTSQNIPYHYTVSTPHILNQTESDLCPMEKIALASQTVEELQAGMQKFFMALNAKQSKGAN